MEDTVEETVEEAMAAVVVEDLELRLEKEQQHQRENFEETTTATSLNNLCMI